MSEVRPGRGSRPRYPCLSPIVSPTQTARFGTLAPQMLLSVPSTLTIPATIYGHRSRPQHPQGTAALTAAGKRSPSLRVVSQGPCSMALSRAGAAASLPFAPLSLLLLPHPPTPRSGLLFPKTLDRAPLWPLVLDLSAVPGGSPSSPSSPPMLVPRRGSLPLWLSPPAQLPLLKSSVQGGSRRLWQRGPAMFLPWVCIDLSP